MFTAKRPAPVSVSRAAKRNNKTLRQRASRVKRRLSAAWGRSKNSSYFWACMLFFGYNSSMLHVDFCSVVYPQVRTLVPADDYYASYSGRLLSEVSAPLPVLGHAGTAPGTTPETTAETVLGPDRDQGDGGQLAWPSPLPETAGPVPTALPLSPDPPPVPVRYVPYSAYRHSLRSLRHAYRLLNQAEGGNCSNTTGSGDNCTAPEDPYGNNTGGNDTDDNGTDVVDMVAVMLDDPRCSFEGWSSINVNYVVSNTIMLACSMLFVWSWKDSGVDLNHPYVMPDWLFVLSSFVWLGTSFVYGDSSVKAGRPLRQAETAAAIFDQIASAGWLWTWWETYERKPGRGFTLDDPDFVGLALLQAAAGVYTVYNVQVLNDPPQYDTNYLYVTGDTLYFVSGLFYLAAALRDAGFLWWLPLAGGFTYRVADETTGVVYGKRGPIGILTPTDQTPRTESAAASARAATASARSSDDPAAAPTVDLEAAAGGGDRDRSESDGGRALNEAWTPMPDAGEEPVPEPMVDASVVANPLAGTNNKFQKRGGVLSSAGAATAAAPVGGSTAAAGMGLGDNLPVALGGLLGLKRSAERARATVQGKEARSGQIPQGATLKATGSFYMPNPTGPNTVAGQQAAAGRTLKQGLGEENEGAARGKLATFGPTTSGIGKAVAKGGSQASPAAELPSGPTLQASTLLKNSVAALTRPTVKTDLGTGGDRRSQKRSPAPPPSARRGDPTEVQRRTLARKIQRLFRQRQARKLHLALTVQRLWRGLLARRRVRHWKRVVDDDGDIFWYNSATQSSSWYAPGYEPKA